MVSCWGRTPSEPRKREDRVRLKRVAADQRPRWHVLLLENCSGWIRRFDLEFGQATRLLQWDLGNIGSVLSFGQDSDGEL